MYPVYIIIASVLTQPSPHAAVTGVFNVRHFGAIGDGVADDTLPIQKAVDAASAANGGTVLLPPGTYLISDCIKITKQLVFTGSGWGTSWSDVASAQGTWLRISKAGFNGVYVLGTSGTTITNIAFVYDQPQPLDGWKPAEFGPSVVIENSRDIFVSNVFLYNSTDGILFFNAQGRLDRILGNPIRTGIEIDRNHDVVTVSHVHFWRYWEGTFEGDPKEVLTSWRIKNGVGIRCKRADNPVFNNIFLIGFSTGFLFQDGEQGPTSKFIVNCTDCDSCRTGMDIGGTHATGMISNFQSQGSTGVVGLRVRDDARVQAINVRITGYDTNGIRVSDNGRLQLSNAWIEKWNRSGQHFPAIEATDNAVIFMDGPLLFDRGNGAHRWGGSVRVRDDDLIEDRDLDH